MLKTKGTYSKCGIYQKPLSKAEWNLTKDHFILRGNIENYKTETEKYISQTWKF